MLIVVVAEQFTTPHTPKSIMSNTQSKLCGGVCEQT